MDLPGLSRDQIPVLRKQYGENSQHRHRVTAWLIFRDVISEPMVILLIVACIFYFISGQYREGIIMGFAIIMVSGISLYQQLRSESAIGELNKLTRQQTTVMRDDIQQEIPSEELVPGDIMMVSEGQQVGADAEILELNDLSVDESILTGESAPVEKQSAGEMLFSGTSVTAGMAWARVTEIGEATQIGRLGTTMTETQKEKTPLQLQVQDFVRKMALFGIIAFLVVWIFNYLESDDVLNSLLHGLTLAMAVLPEEIPVALTTFMALGAYRMIRQNILARHPQTVEALGAASVICLDKTGTITENRMAVSGYYDFISRKLDATGKEFETDTEKELLKIAMLASEEEPFDPMEIAIHERYREIESSKKQFTKVKEYPISGVHPMMTHVFASDSGERIIACKGAPEGIMKLAGLSGEEETVIRENLNILAGDGNRVLAIGKGIHEADLLPASQHELKMEFLGLLALKDPPKKNIPEVIREFYDAGIEVKMITGDYPETAKSIARQIGMHNSEQVLTGSEIEEMGDNQLKELCGKTTVFARVKPEMKLRIINNLKAKGEVVAMTGDGVNDGPALKSAHIGIAMGKRGSEIARIAASLVLVDDNLANMVTAVTTGRKIYSNLKKAIQYIISIHIPLISVVTLPLLFDWKFPNIFSPVHVIFLELIMGPTCSIVYENEPAEPGINDHKPRRATTSLFTMRELSRSMIQGGVITIGLMLLMFFLIRFGSSEHETRTMVFTTLVISNMLLTLTGRSVKQPIHVTIRYRNRLIPIILGATALILILSLTFPPAMEIFGFEPVSLLQFIICFAVALVSVAWIEGYKLARSHSRNHT